MLRSYLYINFGNSMDKDIVEKVVSEYLGYEVILEVGDDYVLTTFDTSDGGVSKAFLRHILMTDDNWIVSASYGILGTLGRLDEGFVVLGELKNVEDKIAYYDVVFKLGTDLILNMEKQEDINYIQENLRYDRKIESIEKLTINGVCHTDFKLDNPILVEVFGDKSIYLDKVRSLNLGGY